MLMGRGASKNKAHTLKVGGPPVPPFECDLFRLDGDTEMLLHQGEYLVMFLSQSRVDMNAALDTRYETTNKPPSRNHQMSFSSPSP